jgi:hypothetical protein
LRLQPALIGIGEASTFSGFCENHDGPLFRVLETHYFQAAPAQMFLLNFRSIVHRLHSAERALQNIHLFTNADRGLTPSQQRQLFAALEDKRIGDEAAVENLRQLKQLYDDRWHSENFAVNALVIELVGPPEFVTASIVEVDVDFAAQQVAFIPPPAHLCFAVLGFANSNVAVWSWLGSNPAAEQLCASFLELSDHHKPAAILRYALEIVDMLYFSPLWWESLLPDIQQRLVTRMTAHVEPYARRATNTLIDDGIAATKLKIGQIHRISA